MRSRLANAVLRAFALVVTDRRWAAPLSAMALGFGVFVGVAVGPGAAGTLAGPAPILALEELGGDEPAPEIEEGASSGGLGGALGAGGAEEEGGGLELETGTEPVPPEPAPAVPPAEEEAAPKPPPAAEPPANEAEETELVGIVAHANPAAGSYALAIEGGELVPLHARELPPAGARLSVVGTRLANGTFAEVEASRRGGKAAQVSFRGAVTFVDPDPIDPAYTVSGRGASLLVHVGPDPSGTVPPLPALGGYVTVTAALGERLDQRAVEVEAGAPATYLDLAGIVQAVLPETSQLVLSADDADEGEADLTLAIPAGIDAGRLKAGDSYLATATVEPDGSLKLAGIVSDERRKGADDESTAQGDLRVPRATSSVARVPSTPRSLRPCPTNSDCF